MAEENVPRNRGEEGIGLKKKKMGCVSIRSIWVWGRG